LNLIWVMPAKGYQPAFPHFSLPPYDISHTTGELNMDVYPFLLAVREKRPLVHHITNWVTIYDCAQVVKSLGASPVMAHAPEESAEMCGIASALALNIGTLTCEVIESMKIAGCAANKRNIPVILDVCGAGATSFRDHKCLELLDSMRVDILKGNSSEIARIAGHNVQTRGVDTTEVQGNLCDIASELAVARNCTVVITGKEDILADSHKTVKVKNGSKIMPYVVGTGCMATSVIGAFAGASPKDKTFAAAAGLCCYEIAAELAAFYSAGPASFKQNLLDCIYSLTESQVDAMQKVTE
jgi:hydroxyethylthiazole kinase